MRQGETRRMRGYYIPTTQVRHSDGAKTNGSWVIGQFEWSVTWVTDHETMTQCLLCITCTQARSVKIVRSVVTSALAHFLLSALWKPSTSELKYAPRVTQATFQSMPGFQQVLVLS